MKDQKYGLFRITFIIADTLGSRIEAQHTGNILPYKKRTAKITLTDKQMAELNIHKVGKDRGVEVYEEVLECFVDTV